MGIGSTNLMFMVPSFQNGCKARGKHSKAMKKSIGPWPFWPLPLEMVAFVYANAQGCQFMKTVGGAEV